MLVINRKNILHASDSNPEPTASEPSCPRPTAVIFEWKELTILVWKKSKTTLLNE